MNTLIISGSQRRNSESSRIARVISNIFENIDNISSHSITLIDLADYLQSWWSDDPHDAGCDQRAELREMANACDGFICIAPEWGGMVPPILKNFFLLMDGCELAHKPGLIVSISASHGGSYPVQELRASSYKNTKLVWLPDHIIIRDVTNFALDIDCTSETDDRMRQRISHSLQLLLTYTTALSTQREILSNTAKKYLYGM